MIFGSSLLGTRRKRVLKYLIIANIIFFVLQNVTAPVFVNQRIFNPGGTKTVDYQLFINDQLMNEGTLDIGNGLYEIESEVNIGKWFIGDTEFRFSDPTITIPIDPSTGTRYEPYVISLFTRTFSLTPKTALGGYYWQFLTYMFMHGGFFHIFINMFVLLIFGFQVENTLGWRRFLTLYLASGIFSSVFYTLLTGEATIMMLGASGAVFAVLTAYAFKFPNNIVFIGFFFPLPAKYAVILFAGLEFFSGIFDLEMGVANFGHLGGIIAGALLMLYWRRADRNRRAPEFHGLEFIWE